MMDRKLGKILSDNLKQRERTTDSEITARGYILNDNSNNALNQIVIMEGLAFLIDELLTTTDTTEGE